MVDHVLGSEYVCQNSQFSKAFADRVALRVAVYDPVMSSSFLHPSCRNPKKIRVMAENGSLFVAGVGQLLFIRQARVARIPGGGGILPPSFQALRNGDIEALVRVDPDFAHGPKRVLMGFSSSAGR